MYLGDSAVDVTDTPTGWTLANDRLRVEIDGLTGAIRQVENLHTGQRLLTGEPGDAWRLRLWEADGARIRHGVAATVAPPSPSVTATAKGLSVTWTTDAGFEVHVEIRLPSGGHLELWPRVAVGPDVRQPLSLTYPILGPLRELSPSGSEDRLILPAHSGIQLRRPFAAGSLTRPYPDGYDGCSMQFLAYFAEATGGFYVAAHDPHSTWKHLRFGEDELSIEHEAWDRRAGVPLDLGYPVVVAPMTIGDWHEAADHYRAWALSAPWCCPGDGELPSTDRAARAWLHEEVGLALWGPPSSIDWSAWYRHYAETVGTPLHINAGWDWPASRPPTVGRDGWFPARFHPANVEAWQGHRVTPYLNDLFVSAASEDFAERWEPHLVYPYATFQWARFADNEEDLDGDVVSDPAVTTNVDFFACPATAAQQQLHAWRDARLVADHGFDGVCYDISSGNPRLASRCWRTEHGHPPGRGRHMIEAYDRMNRMSKAVARDATGRYLVQGVETIIENIIGSVDFYVARAAAGPLGGLETWTLGAEDEPGTGQELIPLFDAVYHDVGPVREDGWLTLAVEQGDLFYWIAARIVLQWGGLLSLHYAINPPERIPGHVGPAELIDWGGARRRFEDLPVPDPAKASFAEELAHARTALATAYLGHGRLLRPASFATDRIQLAFERRLPRRRGFQVAGSWSVPAVVHGAWQAPDGAIGLVFVNLDAGAARTVSLHADLDRIASLDRRGRAVHRRTRREEVVIGSVGTDNQVAVDLELEPQQVTLLEVG